MPTLDLHGAERSLAPVLELEDAIGVLSMYVDADPALGGAPRPAWQAPVRAALRTLASEAREEWPRAERAALEERLGELEGELESLLDPRGTSRGRALFAGIDGGELRRIELRTPLPTLVALDRTARVLPLAAAFRAGGAAGVVTVSRQQLDLLEWEQGALRSLETVELEPGTEPGRGRPATNPAVPQSFPERDRFAGGVEARVAARLREAGARLRQLAGGRGWDAIVVDGDPRLVVELAFATGEGELELVPSDRPLAGVPAGEAAARAGAVLERVRAERVERLLGLLRTPAATTDRTTVVRALDEGRVAHLLLGLAGGGAASRETLLRRALATAAEVTVLDPAPVQLGDDGVAALLRW
jgi:hypothetical protein